MTDDPVTIHAGDCLDVLKEVAANTFDAVVTDPPYELSNDGKNSPNRVLFEFAFPEHSYVNANFTGGNELSLLVSKVLSLRGIGTIPTPSAAMPVISVALDGDTPSWQENIEDAGKGSVCVSDRETRDCDEAETPEHLGCFALKLTDAAAFFDLLNGVGSGFFAGGVGVGFGVTPARLPSFSHSSASVIFGGDAIGSLDDALSELVSAFRGTEDGPVFRFDMGRRPEEVLTADGARLLCCLLICSGAELVRARPTASSLPPVLEARRISVVDGLANRAFSFDLVLHPQSITTGGFMSKAWDGSKIAYDVGLWAAVLRVMKPGAHLVAFGAPRNYHRLACAIEDAGFEVRDSLMWVFGSGFPKSLDVSKAIDKAAGAEREVIGANPNSRPNMVRVDAAVLSPRVDAPLTAPATDEAKEWAGWGTALKPAYEPIILARKPLSEKTVAANVQRWGTGALNIDATRVETAESTERPSGVNTGVYGADDRKGMIRGGTNGRWPANFAHDGSEEVLAGFPQSKSTGGQASLGAFRNGDVYGKGRDEREARDPGYGDEGSAARFFYCAKAGKADRAGSKHPTVKPVSLMRWLVRMVTPPNGTLLDPFAGSGTTGQAAIEEGFNAVLIEREEEYRADIQARMNAVSFRLTEKLI